MKKLSLPLTNHQYNLLERLAKAENRKLNDYLYLVFAEGLRFLHDEHNVYVKKLRWKLQANLARKITGSKVLKISRRAKYIIISGKNFYLTIHLGMTGTLRIANKGDFREKHDHFELYLSSNLILRFNDPRKFGMIFYSDDSPLLSNKLLTDLGPEPLRSEFNPQYLYEI